MSEALVEVELAAVLAAFVAAAAAAAEVKAASAGCVVDYAAVASGPADGFPGFVAC